MRVCLLGRQGTLSLARTSTRAPSLTLTHTLTATLTATLTVTLGYWCPIRWLVDLKVRYLPPDDLAHCTLSRWQPTLRCGTRMVGGTSIGH